MSDLNIYQRLNEVRKSIDYIKKDAKVQGYKAVTHDLVTSEVRQYLIDNGIIIVPHVLESETNDVGVSKSGSVIIRYEARFNIEFVNIDNPEDKVGISVDAHANDMGDKAPGKAVSYATKYAILKVFNIETGENEESRQEMKPKGKITGENIDMVKVKKAVNYFKAQIDEDHPDDAPENIKKGWERLSSDEQLEAQEWLTDKAPGTNRMYKTLLKEYLNHKDEEAA